MKILGKFLDDIRDNPIREWNNRLTLNCRNESFEFLKKGSINNDKLSDNPIQNVNYRPLLLLK